VFGAALALGARDPYAVITFGLAGFVSSTVLIEFIRGARVRARSIESGFIGGLVDLMNRNHRRYGGYIVHLGIVLLFIGFSGKAFEVDVKQELAQGESFNLRGYTFLCEELIADDTSDPNYVSDRMTVSLSRNGKKVATLTPERRYYHASEQPTTEVDRYSSFREDVYMVFVKVSDDAPAALQVFVNPLVRWVWLGGFVMAFGSLFTFLPDARRRRNPNAEAARVTSVTEDAARV
jgi:cytochrome c-type biogenesis protein CcmF